MRASARTSVALTTLACGKASWMPTTVAYGATPSGARMYRRRLVVSPQTPMVACWAPTSSSASIRCTAVGRSGVRTSSIQCGSSLVLRPPKPITFPSRGKTHATFSPLSPNCVR